MNCKVKPAVREQTDQSDQETCKSVMDTVIPILVYEHASSGSPYVIQGFSITAWGQSKLSGEG